MSHPALVERLEAVLPGMVQEGATLVVACSGGRDSMAMLHALVGLDRWPLVVATVDHGLHPTSAVHARFVARRARVYGLPVEILHADRDAIDAGPGLEAGARSERLRLLELLAQARGAAGIVTAHTADDQAETVLMRIVDGTGLRGLAGIPSVRGQWLRPWLGVTRDDVAAYAHAEGVAWCEDPTNADPRFRRNALRVSVGLRMDGWAGAGWTARAAQTASNARDALELNCWLLDRSGLMQVDDHAVRLDGFALDSMPPGAARALIAAAFDRAAHLFSPGAARTAGRHVPGLLALAAGARVSLPGKLRGRRTTAALIFEPVPVNHRPPEPTELCRPGRTRWGRWTIEVEEAQPFLGQGHPGALVAVDATQGPWIVRSALPGDRLQQMGAPGSKALTRLWRDAGVERGARSGLPVIECEGKVIFAACLRTAERARAREGEPVWRITVTDTRHGSENIRIDRPGNKSTSE